MATANAISPSEEKALYMRMQALLVDGGTIVLRSLLDRKHPTSRWTGFLNQQQTRATVTRLRNQKVINPAQFGLLYPSVGTTDRSKYDVSLILCLLRNFCGLNARSAVWTGIPPSADVSEEADIRRLLIERNELAHKPSASINRQDFEVQWKHIEDVLVRLGGNIPDLKHHIDRLKEENIDPKKEKELKDIIKMWEESDKSLKIDLQEVKTEVQKHSQELADMHTAVKSTQEETIKIQDQVDIQEQGIRTLTKKFEEADDSHKKLENELLTTNLGISEHKVETGRRFEDNERSLRETHDFVTQKVESLQKKTIKMSPELKSLTSFTKMFLEDCLSNELFIKTSKYNEAKEKLEKNNLVVLSGHPGEGKTTMAMKLMLEVTDINKCLRLSQPSDWRLVDVEAFETVFIDDIFGPGVLDDSLVKGWDRHLPEIWKAIQKKKLKVIIATRHYILEEARQMFNKSSVFKEEHVQFLSSKDLTIKERTQMLEAHMRYNDRMTEHSDNLIRSCVEVSSDFFLSSLFHFRKESVLFGFPECVNMFVQNEDLFQSGSSFFESPNEFVWDKLEDLRKDEKKFLALLIMWTTPNKVIHRSDLEASYETEFKDTIANVTNLFGFKLKAKLLKTLRRSLKHHTNGYIRYSEATGAYSFSHNVISDMVGLVISEDNQEVCLQFTDRDFLLNYITIDKSEETRFRFYVEPCLHENLMRTFLRVAQTPSIDSAVIDLLTLKRGGRRPNRIEPFQEIDPGVFFHDAFSDGKFVDKFVKYIVRNERLDEVIQKPVMGMSGYFLSYGLKLQKMDICLPAYSLFHSKGILFMEMLKERILPIDSDETYMALLISTHENQFAVVDALINSGVKVSQEAIYVAAVKDHTKILERLLQTSPEETITKGELEKNNNALMVATKMGLEKSVKLLTPFTDLSLRNDHNVSALDKAIIHKHEEIAKFLIDNGAPINQKGGKFKRTPLHTSSDMGLAGIVGNLLRAGARTDIKDHRGHYPLHCAAIQDHIDVVRMLVMHDRTQVRLRISSYRKDSKIKGMTVFHVAVWKENKEMIEALLKISQDCDVQDWFGRTPIYCAAFEGKEEIVELLLPFADVKIPDKHGYTPLHAAIHKGHSGIAKLLLPRSNVNAQDKYGGTPLHAACRNGDSELTQILLEERADPHMRTKNGHTVLDILRQARRTILQKEQRQSLLNLLMGDSAPNMTPPVKTNHPDVNGCLEALLDVSSFELYLHN